MKFVESKVIFTLGTTMKEEGVTVENRDTHEEIEIDITTLSDSPPLPKTITVTICTKCGQYREPGRNISRGKSKSESKKDGEGE